MKKNKIISDKKEAKLKAGRCIFCKTSDYSVLDLHRIKEGANGGKYTKNNVICCCSNCHRQTHAGQIKILGWVSIGYSRLLHIEKDGKEDFLSE